MKRINVIMAATRNGEIGVNGTLPWNINGDLKRFKQLTMGNIVIMGRKTYESLPKPLEGRTVIVVSKTLMYSSTGWKQKTDVCVEDFKTAIILANNIIGTGEIFIIGGAKIYEEGLKIADRVYLTLVNKDSPNGYDTKIYNFNLNDFEIQMCDHVTPGISDLLPVWDYYNDTGIMYVSHAFQIYDRKEQK